MAKAQGKSAESASQGLRLEWMDAEALAANPANWRAHPQAQVKAMRAVLAEVGWAGALLYNERTGRLIDGHLRKEVVRRGKVPVLVGSWSEEQERKILATLDPLSAMAAPDQDKLLALLADVKFESPDVNAMLEALANGETQPMPRFDQMVDTPSQEGIERREGELAHTFEARDKAEKAEHVEIVCPECGKVFTVKVSDIVKRSTT